MASIFTYQDAPPRIHSPWSTPGSATPRPCVADVSCDGIEAAPNGVTRLEPEKQDGPCEYKLHLLLRARRRFVSMTTTDPSMSSLDVPSAVSRPAPRSMSEVLLQRPHYQPSPQTRQARLQQLTTQLLWRLQQSSPFHSSSNAELVLPVLPEATPRLGVPERPAKLLPGLEESQGALYEIGVADDGALVGLVSDELEESLNNLRSMAASLGCVVDILRKLQVGTCSWIEPAGDSSEVKSHLDNLYVAEVLVRPDSRAAPDIVLANPSPVDGGDDRAGDLDLSKDVRNASIEQLRVAFVGSSTCGKSSLVGTLTTSMLDNGRGKSRLSLLKHRHEIASGVTSSVAQELVGYRAAADNESFVVNYASGDVSSWTDIHNLADRLCFLTDSPGLPRYAKSAFRAVVSWKPQWTVFCLSADDDDEADLAAASTGDGGTLEPTLSLAFLDMCLRLRLPLVVAIAKMDLATKAGLRNVLAKVLSTLKSAGRKPVLLSTASIPIPLFALDSKEALPDLQRLSTAEVSEVDKTVTSLCNEQEAVVPIVMTSAVTGSGIGKLHALLQRLPTTLSARPLSSHGSSLLRIDEVFSIPPSRVYSADASDHQESSGIVLCGHLEAGQVKVGAVMLLGPFLTDESIGAPPIIRAKSCTAQDLQKAFRSVSVAKSYPDSSVQTNTIDNTTSNQFAKVRVVSIRNLRLPVLSMKQGETGTVGIELVNKASTVSLQRARKGMILSADVPDRSASRSFAARFPSTDFAGASSPPLILGGHAIAYVNSVRAAVKVTAVALVEDERTRPSSPVEMFAFDGDGEDEDSSEQEEKEITITFRFVSTIEWIEEGDQVLVVPTVTAAGPVTGPPVTSTGLAGFVGRIVEVHVRL